MSMTRDLVRLVRGKEVCEADLEAAALYVLDTLACGLGALKTEPARILGKVAPAANGDVARRAFYLGGLCHILEMDDLHRDSVTHPGAVVVPAAWALADAMDLGGRAFLRSVLVGYEACCRIGNSVGTAHYRVWHNTSTCGPFGAAMAAAALLGLDEERTVWALGNAGTQSSGLWQFLESGAMSKHLHTARAAESGLLAALLASEGFTGPAAILEGEKGFYAGLCPNPRPEAVLEEPGRAWELTRTSIKPWPCCRHTHPAIDAALALHDAAGMDPDEIVVRTYQAALDVCDRPAPRDQYSARFSLQHTVAAALADGAVTPASFEADARTRLARLATAVRLDVAPALDAAYPGAWGAQVWVRLVDGREIEATRPEAKGDPENPVTPRDIEAKARMLLAAGGVAEEEAARLVEAVSALVDDAPVRTLDPLGERAACPLPRAGAA